MSAFFITSERRGAVGLDEYLLIRQSNMSLPLVLA